MNIAGFLNRNIELVGEKLSLIFEEETFTNRRIYEMSCRLAGGLSLALSLEITLEEFGKTIQPHPTLSEDISEAALDAIKETIHLPKKK